MKPASWSKTSSDEPLRYFIALLPPQTIQTEATAIKHVFKERYQSKAALRSPPHITLQPPFEWPKSATPKLEQALTQFATQANPIPISLLGFSAFPPRVIYINVLKTPELMTLQAKLIGYLESTLSIVPSRSKQRPFSPHLTVAFRDLKPAQFRQAWPEFKNCPFQAEFVVPNLTLLLHDGVRWHSCQHFTFES